MAVAYLRSIRWHSPELCRLERSERGLGADGRYTGGHVANSGLPAQTVASHGIAGLAQYFAVTLNTMLSRLRHHCAKRPWLWATLLALTFVWQPVMSKLSELHAIAHGHVAGHLVPADHAEIPAGPDAPDESDFLHALLHATACCPHVCVLPRLVALTVPINLVTAAPLAAESHFESVSPSRMLRPPITA